MKNKNVPENEIHITFKSLSENEGFARSVAASFTAMMNPTVEEMSDIKCVVSEAVTNAIVHGYRNSFGEIRMVLRRYPGRKLIIDISDRGCGISDIAQAMEPLFTTDAENERSGMGFAVMQAFTDKIKVTSREGCGTKVKMIKTLGELPGR